MQLLEVDVGCMKFPEVVRSDLDSTPFSKGIVFVYDNELVTVGCYSLLGPYAGWVDGSIFGSIFDTGAPWGKFTVHCNSV